MSNDKVFMNVQLDKKLRDDVEQMAREDGYEERAPFVRWLIKREWQRRQQEKAATQSTTAKNPGK